VIKRQRGHRISAPGKQHDTDAVSRTFFDEGPDDGLDRLQAVDALAIPLVILGKHRGGEINRQHDIVTLRVNFAFVFDALRPCEPDNHKNQTDESECDRPARDRGE